MPNVEEKYRAALETHRHYDTLSITSIAGMFAVTYGCLSMHNDLEAPKNVNLILYAGVVALGLLYALYLKLSNYALVARNVSKELEKEDGMGISEVYYLFIQNDEESKKKREPYVVMKFNKLLSVRNLVASFALGQVFVLWWFTRC